MTPLATTVLTHGGDLHGVWFWIAFLGTVVGLLTAAMAWCLVRAVRVYDAPARPEARPHRSSPF